MHIHYWGGWVEGLVVRAAGRMFSWYSDYEFTPPVLWNHLVVTSPNQTTALNCKLRCKMPLVIMHAKHLQRALDGSLLVHLMGKAFWFFAAVWDFRRWNGPVLPALEKLLAGSPAMWPRWLAVWVCSVQKGMRTNMVFHIFGGFPIYGGWLWTATVYDVKDRP